MHVENIRRSSGGVINVSIYNAKHEVLFLCNFQKNGGFEIEATQIKKGVFEDKRRRCKNEFIESAEEVVEQAKNFQIIADWHGLSLRAQHVLAKDDLIIPISEELKELQMKMTDLWVACDSTGTSRRFMEVELTPSHPDYKKALKDKKGLREQFVCDNGYSPRGIDIKPLFDGAYVVQYAVRQLSHCVR